MSAKSSSSIYQKTIIKICISKVRDLFCRDITKS